MMKLQCRLPAMLKISAAILAVTVIAVTPKIASAGLRVCNDTSSLVGVSLGYRKDNNWRTEGWWRIPGNQCASLINGTLESRYYYVYAEDAERGGQWRGEVTMCTRDREFTIIGNKNCFQRGHQKTDFFEIDTGERGSWLVKLTDRRQ